MMNNVSLGPQPTSWEAASYPQFINKSQSELQRYLGVKDDFLNPFETSIKFPRSNHWAKKLTTSPSLVQDTLPESFDSKDKWNKCPTISQITDQSNCGSCYAVSVAGVASDRLCIHSHYNTIAKTMSDMSGIELQPTNTELSAMDIMTCCPGDSCGDGCDGGYIAGSWKYLAKQGVVTGSTSYKSTKGCLNYPLPECHHGPFNPDQHTDKPGCDQLPKPFLPTCAYRCDKDSEVTRPFFHDKYFFTDHYSVQGEKEMMLEIYNNGPLVAFFNVFEDLYSYKSGVYVSSYKKYLGAHAIRIVGWGIDQDSGLKYWRIANSWGTSWGDNGYFNMIRGSNHCALENTPNAALPIIQ